MYLKIVIIYYLTYSNMYVQVLLVILKPGK